MSKFSLYFSGSCIPINLKLSKRHFAQYTLPIILFHPMALFPKLTYLRRSGADKDYIPMFPWTNLFLAVLRLNNKVIFNRTKQT
jgi:hypothetical protein